MFAAAAFQERRSLASAVSELAPILELRDATVSTETPYWNTLREAKLRLDAGQLALVLVDSWPEAAPLTAAVLGLALAQSGRVLFRGHAWNDRAVRLEGKLRGQIGRVFNGASWISNLSVLENVLLACRHHSHRTDAELEQDADDLARGFGLPQVPRGRPAHVAGDVAARSQWVRALLGRPELVLLEDPLVEVPDEWHSGLIRQISEARRRGAAVLWLTDRPEQAGLHGLAPTNCWRLRAQQLVPWPGGSP